MAQRNWIATSGRDVRIMAAKPRRLASRSEIAYVFTVIAQCRLTSLSAFGRLSLSSKGEEGGEGLLGALFAKVAFEVRPTWAPHLNPLPARGERRMRARRNGKHTHAGRGEQERRRNGKHIPSCRFEQQIQSSAEETLSRRVPQIHHATNPVAAPPR
jgi:hypothetical protein